MFVGLEVKKRRYARMGSRKKQKSGSGQRLCVAVFIFLVSGIAAGDEVTVKGTTLRGTIKDVTASGLELDSEYGSGTLKIPYDTIERLLTDEPFLVLYGENSQAFGRLVGVADGNLLILEKATGPTSVPVDSIIESDSGAEADTFSERLRNKYRFWKASTDMGFSFKDSTSDQIDFKMGAKIEYRRRPAGMRLQVNYLLGEERNREDGSSKTDNEARGLFKGEYDVTERYFVYISNDLEYDEIDQISLRWVAKPGPGFRVVETKTVSLQVESGLAFVHERFFGGTEDDYLGIPVGLELSVRLPLDSSLTARSDYLPSLESSNDYLIRAEMAFLVPITKYLSFKTSAFQTYDNQPDEEADRNEFKTILGLTWHF